MKKRLIEIIIAASLGIAVSATAVGCAEKTEEEKNYENEIRKLLQYDANINIDKENVDNYGFKLEKSAKSGEYLLTFKTSKHYPAGHMLILNDCDVITYSVDKDTYYDFSENYSITETKKELDMVTELTYTYDPIKVIENGKEIDLNKEIEKNL